MTDYNKGPTVKLHGQGKSHYEGGVPGISYPLGQGDNQVLPSITSGSTVVSMKGQGNCHGTTLVGSESEVSFRKDWNT